MLAYFEVILCVLLYLLCGLILSVAYIWNYRTDVGEARLGLLTLGWPVVLVLDLILSVAGQFGKVAKKLAFKAVQGEQAD